MSIPIGSTTTIYPGFLQENGTSSTNACGTPQATASYCAQAHYGNGAVVYTSCATPSQRATSCQTASQFTSCYSPQTHYGNGTVTYTSCATPSQKATSCQTASQFTSCYNPQAHYGGSEGRVVLKTTSCSTPSSCTTACKTLDKSISSCTTACKTPNKSISSCTTACKTTNKNNSSSTTISACITPNKYITVKKEKTIVEPSPIKDQEPTINDLIHQLRGETLSEYLEIMECITKEGIDTMNQTNLENYHQSLNYLRGKLDSWIDQAKRDKKEFQLLYDEIYQREQYVCGKMDYVELKPSSRFIDMLKSYEYFSSTIYDANPGNEDYTIGYGHKLYDKNDFEKYANGITEEEALELMYSDLKKMLEPDFCKYLEDKQIVLTQQQFDGIALFLYCWGPHALSSDDKEQLLANGNINDKEQVRKIMGQFARNASLDGHIARINDIIELINEGDYERGYNYDLP